MSEMTTNKLSATGAGGKKMDEIKEMLAEMDAILQLSTENPEIEYIISEHLRVCNGRLFIRYIEAKQ